MALWDGPYVLGQFDRFAGRPDADQIQDATKYLWLSEAQHQVVADIAARQPEVLYPVSAVPMITADGGKTWTFGNDTDGNPIFPLGKTMIYRSKEAVPQYPLTPGYDYMEEGNRIEMLNNRSFAGPLYYRGVILPPDITTTQPPLLQPPPARQLIVELAVKNFGQAGAINPELGQSMTELWSRDFPRWMLVFRTQYASGGVLGPLVSTPTIGPYSYGAYLPGTSAL